MHIFIASVAEKLYTIQHSGLVLIIMWDISTNSTTSYLTPKNWTRWEVGPRPDDLFFFESIDDNYWYNFQMDYWWIAWAFTGAYWVAAYTLKTFMKDREPLDVNGYMVTYNILVSIFSIFAMWRGSSTFFSVLFSGSDGFYKSVCVRFPITEKEVFWMVAGTWSKLLHLLDTIFALLKKKPIQFMQMYHHSVVVLVPQLILPYGEPILLWWGFMNIVQHSLTYPYFALKAMQLKVPRIAPAVIVIVEVLQMLAGLGTGVYTLYVLRNGGNCVRHPRSIYIINFVYVTLGILAVRMAYQHFQKQARPEKNKSS